jgi:glycosyltransferase involved in cell wall biosynthesis
MSVEKKKIVLDGTVLSMALDSKLARTGVFFVVKNLCDALISRKDVELKLLTLDVDVKRLYREYPNLKIHNSLDLTSLKVGVDYLNFLMPFHPANASLFEIPRASVFQVIHDLSGHACPELKNSNRDFEKTLIASLKPNGYALCVSRSTQDDLISLAKYPKTRSEVFYPGVKSEISQYLIGNGLEDISKIYDLLDIPVNAHYVLSLSTIEPRKNLTTALKAFEFASEALDPLDLYYVITGAQGWADIGTILDEVPDKIKKKIRLTGYLDDRYIPHLYRQAICLLYPSFYEGFGMPVIEAMACGTPVIVSDRASLPEISGNCAKVLDAYDSKGMARAISEWYMNPDIRAAAGRISEDYAKNFTWKRSAQQIIDFISRANSTNL